MKKLLVLLVVLAMVAIASPLYSQSGDVAECEYCGGVHDWSGPHNVVIGGEFQYGNSWNTDGNFAKVELNINATVGDHNSVQLELDSEGDDWAGENEDDAITWGPQSVAIDDFRVNTDIFGALGLDLPVTLNTTIGYFDTYFTGWKYVSYSGWDFYYGNWPISGNSLGPEAEGAMQADVGVGPVTVSVAAPFNAEVIRAGLSAGFGPVGVYASLGGTLNSVDVDPYEDLVINAMSDFSTSFGDLSLYVPAHVGLQFNENFDAGHPFAILWWAGGGVAVDYTSLVHFAAGIDYASSYDTDDGYADGLKFVADLSSMPIGGLQVGVSAFMDFYADAVFSGLDAYVNYKFGAAMFQVGLAYVPDGGDAIPVLADSFAVDGVYVGIDIDL
jgi:hypothetical protein